MGDACICKQLTHKMNHIQSCSYSFNICKGRLDMARKCKQHHRFSVRFKKGVLPQRRQGKLTEKMEA